MFELPKLPYNYKDLEPYISEETVMFHYEKHHKTYVNNVNLLLKQHERFQDYTLEDIIKGTANNSNFISLFNNAAQAWNHTFYWESMIHPSQYEKPNGLLLEQIQIHFGSFDTFVQRFKESCITHFGSGWVFLVLNDNKKLSIMNASNADTPMVYGKIALLTCDVWEHAYYIDYRNLRAKYVDIFMDHLVNWSRVSDRLLENM